jgi:hypothetical protein
MAEPVRLLSVPSTISARVKPAAVAVPAAALAAGAVVGLRDPRWALLAAAVVFGWSLIGSA